MQTYNLKRSILSLLRESKGTFILSWRVLLLVEPSCQSAPQLFIFFLKTVRCPLYKHVMACKHTPKHHIHIHTIKFLKIKTFLEAFQYYLT